MKVSIIVPVYNSSKTLIECVKTLLTQTLQDIEIILIDDCSTDNSYIIMESLQEKFPNKIKITKTPVNQGAGGARNYGLKLASGEYIGFVDSDDIVDMTMYEKLYNEAIRTGYDIIDCGFYREEFDSAIIYASDDLCGILNDSKRNELIASGGYIVTKLFKRDYFFSHNFTFRNNTILEDSEIVTYAFATANTIGNVKEVLYVYKYYPMSSSKTVEPTKYFNACFNAMKAIYDKLSVLPNYSALKPSIEYEMLQMYYLGIKCCIINKSFTNFDSKKCLQQLREFRLQNITSQYNNQYVKEKMSKDDIAVMKYLDESINTLLANIHVK